MHHQPQRRHRRRGRQALADARDVAGPKAQAVHPGVDLDEHLERTRQHGVFEHPHLLHVVHNDGEAALRELRQLALGEEALEQQDAPRVAALAQFECDVGLDQRESVGFLERGQDAKSPCP